MKSWFTTLLSLSVVLLLAVNSPVFAQENDAINASKLAELDLEDLLNMQVTTASKKAEKISDAPGVISTISSEEIKNFGAKSLFDVLQMAPSIQPLSSHLFVQNKVSVRGDLNTHADNHVLVLINGRPIREGSSGGTNSILYQGFPVEMIDKIEIIRGPGSVLYGSNAFAGVINVITKGNENTNALTVSAGAGSFGTTTGSATGSISTGELNATLSAKLLNQEGWDFSAVTKRPGSEDKSVEMKYGQKNIGLAADVTYKNLKFFGTYINNSQDALGILPYATFAGVNKYSRLFLNLGYSYKLSDVWETSLNVSHDGSIYTLNDDALVAEDHHSVADYLAELTISGQIFDKLNLIFGGVVYSRNKNSVENFDAIKSTYNQTHLSAYAQADYKPLENLKLILGAQLNKPDEGDVDLVPRLGAIYEFSDEFGVKALYAQAFRSPWPLEQLITNPSLYGNPDLGPEKIATTDIQLFYNGKKAGLSLTYFNSHYSDLVVRTPYSTGILTFSNKGTMNVYGFELEGKASFTSKLFLTGSASYQKNKEDLTAAPSFMAKAGAFYKLDFGLTVGVFNSYYGKPQENSAPKVNPSADAVSLFDANFIYKLPVSVPLELNLTVQNLFDVNYNFTEFARGWVNTLPVGPGRAIYGGVKLSL